MPTCWIGLGGNLGDVPATFDAALADLHAHPALDVVTRSTMHSTAAVGEHAGAPFRNQVAQLETTLAPLALLDVLHEVEHHHGRTREITWGPRTLDLDLLYLGDHGEVVVGAPRLVVPHPAAWYRRFVLAPLAELAPDLVHPTRHATIAALLARIDARPLRLHLTGGPTETRTAIARHLAGTFTPTELACTTDAPPPENPSRPLEPTLLAWLGPPDPPHFEHLPPLARLDLSTHADPTTFLHDALRSALG